MSFWKKLFGVKESPKDFRAAFAEERPARSVAAGEAVCSRDFGTPDPYTPEQSAAFRKAARDGNLEKVEALLNENSALVFSEDYYGGFGNTALHHAASNGHQVVAELLLARKAKVDAKNAAGLTPLRLAVSHGHKAVVELLLANKARVDAKNSDGTTPLQLAANMAASSCRQETKDLAELLRQHGGRE